MAKFTKKSLTASQVNEKKDDIIRHALLSVSRARKLLGSVENCLEQSRGFPLYLQDFQETARTLDLLAAQHKVLTDLLNNLNR